MFIAWTTVATRADADRLAADLVARGLAACVQVEGPVVSHYRWEGRLEHTEEFRLTLKFVADRRADLEARLFALHPYATPEWIVVAAAHVAEKYLSWANANSSPLPL